MELFLLYLWLKLDSVLSLFTLFLALACVVLIVSLINIGDAKINLANYRSLYNPEAQEARLASWKPWVRRSSFTALLCLGLLAFVPSSKDTAILVGAYIALDVAKSPEGQKIGTLIRAKANELLDNEINKLNKPATK